MLSEMSEGRILVLVNFISILTITTNINLTRENQVAELRTKTGQYQTDQDLCPKLLYVHYIVHYIVNYYCLTFCCDVWLSKQLNSLHSFTRVYPQWTLISSVHPMGKVRWSTISQNPMWRGLRAGASELERVMQFATFFLL